MIHINNVSKAFKVYKRRSGFIREMLGLARPGTDYDIVQSLSGVELTVPSGKVHGIIGMNGAGKSTLLKILTGVIEPSAGSVVISGRVAALLELGTGFHGELTGRENVRLNAMIMGIAASELADKMASIERFAELGDFFDRPVKIYSSGMYVRLAFSFAVSINPDVLIIDEALSVGDAYFQQKCLKKIGEFKDTGTTILFVSHDLGAVRMLCEEVTLLSKGKMIFNGSPMQALDLYNALLAEHKSTQLVAARTESARAASATSRYESGSLDMEITSVALLGPNGAASDVVVAGDRVELVVTAVVNRGPLHSPTCGILIKDRLGYDIFGTNTHGAAADTGSVATGQVVKYRFAFTLNLGAGDYTVTVALHADKSHVDANYHWIDRALLIQVLPPSDFAFIGVAKLDTAFRCELVPG